MIQQPGSLHEGTPTERAAALLRTLEQLDPSSTQSFETRAHATAGLATLARELFMPEAIPVITRHLNGTPWPASLAGDRHQTLQGLGWWHALQGDYFNAFRFLKQAAASAPDNVRKARIAADRAYLAKAIGESRWSRQELDEAETLAMHIDWHSTNETVVLLILAKLFSQVDANKSSAYLAAYEKFGKTSKRSEVDQTFADYLFGVLAIANGEQKEGLKLLHASLDVYNRLGFDWRTAKCLIHIYQANRNSHMLGMAREKLRNYPSSWLSDEIQLLAKENIGSRTVLPPMQQRVFEALCEGLSTIEIAERLGRSPFTVRNHIKEIFKAFNVTSRSALVAEAARRSLI